MSATESASIVMVAVFGNFASLGALMFEGDGRRTGGRRLHRRDDRPRGAATGDDEAAG
jgi:hypothetical protein